jgi:hypothetical protein
MNCQDFENLVVDLARGAVADSSLGTGCWAHAANCPRCADRLLAQEKLTAGLDALTTRMGAMPAAGQFEDRLRSEFRIQFAGNRERAVRPPAIRVFPYLKGRSLSGWAWAGAAAILLLSIAGILGLRSRTKLPVMVTAQDRPGAKEIESHGPKGNKTRPIPAVLKEKGAGQTAAANSIIKPHESRPGKNNSKAPARPTFRKTAQDEIATSFYPLPYGSGLSLDEGWEIVRVSMPRSALATLGVPMSAEQSSSSTIKADLVLGEDGMARAIRFVE